MPARARPLSPHLTIYRWQIGNTLSILHRATGALLALGLIALAYWWTALAAGPEAYHTAARVLAGPLGLLVLGGFSLAFWYHLLNGVRHLFWDAGRGFEKSGRRVGGMAVVIGAVVLTVVLWLIVWRHLS
jgi:succinate dehydrogenase / fumarate reductase, cytochrome b subunit